MQVNTIVPLIDKCPARELVKIEARTKRPLIRPLRGLHTGLVVASSSYMSTKRVVAECYTMYSIVSESV